MQERFAIANIGADIVDILSFRWGRIYTTNYDNSIDSGLAANMIRHKVFNNMDQIDVSFNSANVVHLHGRAASWNLNNFEKSCILGYESYRGVSFLEPWLDIFQQDLDRAEIVVFVGFNANDFHLNQVLHNVAGLKDKIYFINRVSAEPDVDIDMMQARFGTPLYVGREGLAENIRALRQVEPLSEPALASFKRYDRVKASATAPSVLDIENFLVFGRFEFALIARDIDSRLQELHFYRETINNVMTALSEGGRIALITGEPCDGKTIAVNALARRLDIERTVYVCNLPYNDIADEAGRLLNFDNGAALVIENCFELGRDRLMNIARQIDAAKGYLILSSRNISAEANVDSVKTLRALASFREHRMGALGESEVNVLINLADQIAGWSDFKALSTGNRFRFIVNTCNSSLPSFLLKLLKSKYVENIYREEYGRLNDISREERLAIVTALYIGHIGERASLSLLSEAYSVDMIALLKRLENTGGLRLLRQRGDFVETVPSIGATNLLRHVVDDAHTIQAVIRVLKTLTRSSRRDNHRSYIFNQMMRYNILHPVIENQASVIDFFDQLSKIDSIRRKVLFWLQWSIALREQRSFVEAEKKLEQGYREAEIYESRRTERFDRRQLDDVKAKLIVSKRRFSPGAVSPPDLFRDIGSACDIVQRLLRSDNLTHHPYETIQMICELYFEKRRFLDNALEPIATAQINSLLKLARERLKQLPLGYQTVKASETLTGVESSIMAAPVR